MSKSVDLEARIRRLHERLVGKPIVSSDSATPAGGLEARVRELRERVRRQAFPSSEDPSESIGDALNSAKSATEFARKFETLRSKLVDHPKYSSCSDASASYLELQNLSEMGLEIVAQAVQSPMHLARFTPALTCLLRQIQEGFEALRSSHERRAQWESQVQQVREILLELSEGGSLSFREIETLTRSITASADATPPVGLIAARAQRVDEMIARQSVARAHMAVYLSTVDLAWSARRDLVVTSALLQDVGLLEAPWEILDQPGPISIESRGELARHPLLSASILGRIGGLDPLVVQAVACHEERLDGTGYPNELSREEIEPTAALLAVADVYAALISPRPHREALSARDALTTVLAQAESGKLHSGFAAMLLNMSFYPVGTIVELSTGEWAEVAAAHEARQTPSLAASPVVRILRDAGGNAVHSLRYKNLAQHPGCRVVREHPTLESRQTRSAA